MGDLRKKRGQVTIFIIIALVLILIVGGFFLVKNQLQKNNIPDFAEPVETTFLNCLEERTLEGVTLLETNGGSIYFDEIELGSRYMPFSSHLKFMGNEIPYWFYVSGANIIEENVPTNSNLESNLERFLEENMDDCDFESYSKSGFEVYQGTDVKAEVTINENSIEVLLSNDLSITKEENYIIKTHSIEVPSPLGELYQDALNLYNYEQESLFLENYSVDFLRLYAPVDGVEMRCSPLIWDAENVFSDLRDGIETNTLAISEENKNLDYFSVNSGVIKNEFRILNSKNWPYSFEVFPSDNSQLLIANPIGNQQGLGAMGFCYVSYHFVYNIAYPVLIQVYKDDEIFQFPVVILIQGNKPRQSLSGESVSDKTVNICEDNLSSINLEVQDLFGNPLNSTVYFECFSNSCYLGETNEQGILSTSLPQCVNGILLVSSEGYKTEKEIYSSVNSNSKQVYLSKMYPLEIVLNLDGQLSQKSALVNLIGDDGNSYFVKYPESKVVFIPEGYYEINIQVYDDSELTLQETTREQCVDVAKGVLGVIGITRKECFEIKVPEQIITNIIISGGKDFAFFSGFDLQNSKVLEINAETLPTPKDIDELQKNYLILETKKIEVELR